MPSCDFPKLFKLPAAKINSGRARRDILRKLAIAKFYPIKFVSSQ